MHELVVWNPSLPSEAMTVAHELRDSDPSLSMGEALTEAWATIKDDEVGDEDVASTNPLAFLLLVGLAVSVIHYQQSRRWWWQSLRLGRATAPRRRVSLRPSVQRGISTNQHHASAQDVLWPEFKNVNLA